MNFEEIIEKIEDILEEGKPSFGGGGKIKVDGDAIHECLQELSSSIPTEIIQARKIVAERREILHEAQETAGKIISDAQVKAAELTQDHEITKNAKDAALKIMSDANDKSDEIIADAESKAAAREDYAKRWSYELQTNAYKHVMDMMSQSAQYMSNCIAQFDENKRLAEGAIARLENIKIKTPVDDEI